MTPLLSAPTLCYQQNNKQHATETVFNKFIIRTDNSTQAPITPSPANQLPIDCNKETPQTAKHATLVLPTPAKDHISQKIENNLRITGQPKTELRLIHTSLPCHSSCIVCTNQPTNQQNPDTCTPTNLSTQHKHSQYLSTLPKPTPCHTISHQVHKLTESTSPNRQSPIDTLTTYQIKTPPKQAICNPLSLMPSYPLQKSNPATPPSDKMMWTTPILKVQSILSPLQIPDQCAIEPTQTMIQLLWKQIEFTQTLIGCLSQMLMSHSISISPRITTQTLFNLIAKLQPNKLLTILTTPSRTTLQNILVKPTYHQYQFPSKLLGSVKPSTGVTHHHLSKVIIWSIISLTFLHSKDLQKVP